MVFLKKENTSQFSVKTTPKAKASSQTSKTFASQILKTSSQRQGELSIAKYRRQDFKS